MVDNETKQRKWLVLAISTLSLFMLIVNLSVFPIVSVEMARELGLTFTQTGFLMAVYLACYAITQIPSGILSDRFGGEKLASLSLAILGSSELLLAFSSNYYMAIFARVLLGLAAGFIMPATMKFLPTWFSPEEHKFAMGIFGSGSGVGLIFSFITFPSIVVAFGWRSGLISTSALTLFSAALSWIVMRNPKRSPSKTAPKSDDFHLQRFLTRKLVLLSFLNLAAFGTVTGTITYAQAFLTKSVQLSTVEAGYVTAVVGLAEIFAAYAGGLMSTRLGSRIVIIVSMTMCVVFPYVLSYAFNVTSSFIMVAIIGWAAMFHFGPTFAAVPHSVDPAYLGSAFGFFNTLSNLGAAVTPAVVGMVLDATNRYDLGFLSLSFIAIIGLASSLIYRWDT
jgi:nitrate/nitrite transporter NarK